ncbi:MAG: sialidase family protein, partial [Terriglobia bacterium]
FLRFRRIAPLLLIAVASTAAVIVYSKTTPAPALPQITLMQTPAGGIQPQTILDHRGVLHMIYFKGNASAGDIEYVRRDPGAASFSAPIRVNSQPGSAVAIGTVRGPQMALGRGGRVYVIWFGSSHSKPRGPEGKTPVLFSRLNDSGTAFAPQRNLMQYTKGVDGGLSVAADPRGDVYAVWHAMGKVPGEAHRRVYLARSTDDGKTFTREVPVSPASLGACGCCGMRAFVDGGGTLYVLYRAAAGNIHRDMTLLVSADHGRTFRAEDVSSWKLSACPMSTDDLSEGAGRVLAAWEKAGEVYFSEINPRTFKLSSIYPAPGSSADRKHPAVAANARGDVLLAWTEGTAWMKGGSVAWQLFDPAGRPVGQEGHATGVPVWGLPSVFTNRRGDFIIVY